MLLAILEPLRGALGWAAVLAFLLHPLHERLARGLKGRAAVSAGILTGLTPFFVLAPLSVLGVVFAGQVANLIGYLSGRTLLPYPELLQRLEGYPYIGRSEEHTSELQSRLHLVCRLLLEKKKKHLLPRHTDALPPAR